MGLHTHFGTWVRLVRPAARAPRYCEALSPADRKTDSSSQSPERDTPPAGPKESKQAPLESPQQGKSPLESQQPRQVPPESPHREKSPRGPKQDELPGVTPERKPSLKSPGQGPADDTYFVRDAGTQTPFSFPPNVVVVANGAQLTTHRI